MRPGRSSSRQGVGAVGAERFPLGGWPGGADRLRDVIAAWIRSDDGLWLLGLARSKRRSVQPSDIEAEIEWVLEADSLDEAAAG